MAEHTEHSGSPRRGTEPHPAGETHGGHGHPPDVNPEVSHERKDVNVFQITAFGIGLMLACIVVVFAVWAMFDFLYAHESEKNANNPNALMMSQRPALPPQPRLEAEPKIELRDMRANEDAILNSYAWIDQSKGTVRIPIGQALDIVSKKGLPSKPSPAGMDNDGYRTIPEVSSSGRTLEKISQ